MARYRTTSGGTVDAASLAKMIAASQAANPDAAGSNGSLFTYNGAAGPIGDQTGSGGIQQSIIPDPAVYEGETAQALQAYQNALAAISARRANTLQNYGMTAKVDPNGNLQNYGIDPNNQYGAIQQLLGSEGSQITQLQHNSLDRGLGLKGLGAQGVTQARLAGGQAQQQLGSQFTGEIGQEASDQLQAGSQYQAARLQAQRDAIVSAIQNGWFTPAAQGSQGTQPPPGSSTTPPPSATKKPPIFQQRYTSLAQNMKVGL